MVRGESTYYCLRELTDGTYENVKWATEVQLNVK